MRHCEIPIFSHIKFMFCWKFLYLLNQSLRIKETQNQQINTNIKFSYITETNVKMCVCLPFCGLCIIHLWILVFRAMCFVCFCALILTKAAKAL